MNSNEEFVRGAYATAEAMDIQGRIDCFTPDGVFVDNSVAVTYTGPAEVAKPVEYYGAAFSDIHRELYEIFVTGDIVVVQLALQGTHDGALHLPFGMLPPTGKRMDAPCCACSSSRTESSSGSMLPGGQRHLEPARRPGEFGRGARAAARLIPLPALRVRAGG
jgi:hypothetical protein